jgi:ParB-like chromosome segregation protein Spo0J
MAGAKSVDRKGLTEGTTHHDGSIVDITSLKEDPHNPRHHSAKNLEAVTESLKRFGQREPLLVRKGVVIGGNARLAAMRLLGWKAAWCCSADDLPPKEARRLAIALNRTAELADRDIAMLADEARQLVDEDLSIPGYSQDELAALMESATQLADVQGAAAGTGETESLYQGDVGDGVETNDSTLVVVFQDKKQLKQARKVIDERRAGAELTVGDVIHAALTAG